MTKRSTRLAALLGLVVLAPVLSSCNDPSPGSQPSERASADAGSQPYEGLWKLVEGSGPYGDIPVVKGWDITGHIDDGSIYGDTGCNYYLVLMEITDSTLSFQDGGYHDQVGCSNQVTAQDEEAYFAALFQATEIARDDDRVILSGPDSRLVFESVPPPPIDEIAGRRWELKKVFATYPRTRVISVQGEFLLHQGGRYEASVGCMRERGKWIVSGDRVIFTESSNRGRCSQDELNRYATSAGGALGEGFTAEVDGNKLTIFAARSRDRLVYRAR